MIENFVSLKNLPFKSDRYEIGYKVSLGGQHTNGLQIYYLKIDLRYYAISVRSYIKVAEIFDTLSEFTNKEIIDYLIENQYLYNDTNFRTQTDHARII